jgi:hypothetical protein
MERRFTRSGHVSPMFSVWFVTYVSGLNPYFYLIEASILVDRFWRPFGVVVEGE